MLFCLQHLTNKVLWRLYFQPMNLHAAGSHIHSSPSQHRLPFHQSRSVVERTDRWDSEADESVWCQVLCKQPPPHTAQHAQTHTHLFSPSGQPVLIIHPFPGTACAIKRFLNEDEALRSKLFEWFLWMTQGLVASWEEDQTRWRRQLCRHLSWMPCHLSLTFN